MLEVSGLSKAFRTKRRGDGKFVPAVRDVSLSLAAGETLAVVGESGAGKSTVGRLILRLIEPDGGDLRFDGTDLRALSTRELRAMRARMQMIFQDPYSSFDPLMTVGESIAEPLKLHRDLSPQERHQATMDLLERVGLPRTAGRRYPRSFSGGQLQRLAIARALSTDPALVVCDEPVSALDISIRGQILSLLVELQDERDLGYIFISHDLSVVEQFAHRVAVMYGGRIVETGTTSDVFERPQHPYTIGLLDSIPIANPRHRRKSSVVKGEPLSAPDLGAGCAYRARCPHAMPTCETVDPALVRSTSDDHQVACHLISPSEPRMVNGNTAQSAVAR